MLLKFRLLNQKYLKRLLIFFSLCFFVLLSASYYFNKQISELTHQGFGSIYTYLGCDNFSNEYSSTIEIKNVYANRNIKLKTIAIVGQLDVVITNSNNNKIFEWKGKITDRSIKLPIDDKQPFVANIKIKGLFLGGYILAINNYSLPPASLNSNFIKNHPKDSDDFYWPYFLYIPHEIKKSSYLIVEPNNTGVSSDNFSIHLNSATHLIKWKSKLAEKLQLPLLVPVFPRPNKNNDINIHDLNRKGLTTNISKLKRVDLQLLAMIEHAKMYIKENRNIDINDKVILTGFSSSGSFVDRFSLIHPEKVKLVIAGGLGGLPTLPIKKWKNKKLRFPVGTYDLEEITGKIIDIDKYKEVPHFYYIGGDDENDATIYRDTWEEQDAILINEIMGTALQERWNFTKNIITDINKQSTFKIYPDIGHTIDEKIETDIEQFINSYATK